MMQPSDSPYGVPPTSQMGGMSLGPTSLQQGSKFAPMHQMNLPPRQDPSAPPSQAAPFGGVAPHGSGLGGIPSSQQTALATSIPRPGPPGMNQMRLPPKMPESPPSRPGIPTDMMPGPPQFMPPSGMGAPRQQIRPMMTGPPQPNMGPPGPQNPMMAPGAPPNSMMGPGAPPNSMTGPGAPPNSMTGPGAPPNSMMGPGAPPNSMMAPGAPPNSMMAPGAPPNSMTGPGAPPNSMMGPSTPQNSVIGRSGPPNSMLGPGPPQSMQGHPNQFMTGPPQSMKGPPGQSMQGPPGQSMMGPPGQSMQGPAGQSMMGPPGQSMMGPPGQNMMGPPGQNMMGPPGQNMMGPPGAMNQRQPVHQGAMPLGPPGPRGYPQQPGPPGMATAPGVQQNQPRAKIDPDNMPNPVAVMTADQEQRGGVPFQTSTRGLPPPLVTTQYRVKDDGNCSPRYLRSTMYTAPCTKDLLNGCKVPLGLVIQPLADVPAEENTLQLVDHGASGPLRCNRCKAYMNPYARFIDGGRQYMCPVCQCSNEVPPEYFSHLDHQGRRTDTMQRPELMFGSVEYIANKDYCKEGKTPLPPAYIFMIDVSYASVQSGLVSLLSQTMLSILDQLPGSSDENGSPVKVGFMTYDKVIQFYNVSPSLATPQMMVLTDISDVFVPMVDGFLVSVSEARTVLEGFLSQLPELFSNNKCSQTILAPVVKAGMETLKAAGRNGRLFVFHSSLPTFQAPGLLKNRLDQKLLGTDKEKTLLVAAGNTYQKLGEECVKFGVGVELFLFPSSYSDVATLAKFSATTGGELHLYRNYQTSRDGERLVRDLRASVKRSTGFDAVMRVRASTGLRPTGFYGTFLMSNTTDIELGNIDANKSIAVEIKHDDKLREDDLAFFQAALLYTNVYGQRRLRVHNIAMGCSTKYQDIYRSCDIDTLMTFFSKSIIQASLSMAYKTIRDNFSHQCAVILSCYRKQCSSQSPPGQLILPESLKLLPMYANCLLKSDALLTTQVVTLDEKCWMMYLVLSMSPTQMGAFIYPRVYALHDLNAEDKGLPPLLRCTGGKLAESGAYLVENGLQCVIWLGQHLSNEFISQLFGVGSLAQVNTDLHALPALDNQLSFRVRAIMSEIQASRQHSMKLAISKQRDKTEVLFRRLLKEDKGAGQWEGTSYVDFLCNVHREIKELLS